MRLVAKIQLMIVLSICLMAGASCDFWAKKKTDWSVDLSEKNKNPFGLYLAYNSLPLLFPESKCSRIDATYKFTDLSNRFKNDTEKSAVIIVGQSLNLLEREADSIIALAEQGHTVVLAVTAVDDALMQKLRLRKTYGEVEETDKTQCTSIKTSPLPQRDFCYRGYTFSSRFVASDTSTRLYRILGTNGNNEPDYISYGIGKGKIFLHATPFVFTNFFLLQNNNEQYLRYAFSYIPAVKNVVWMNFNMRVAESEGAWSFMWKHPGTRMFILLSLLVLLLYVLFELKRKQKPIPILKPNTNSSVAFVETIGRLYYNKGNHQNLAEKMIQHFLEHVRSNYYLNTSALDEEFVQLLASKSGVGKDKTASLVADIKQVQQGTSVVDDAFLFSLHSQIQQFYNQQ